MEQARWSRGTRRLAAPALAVATGAIARGQRWRGRGARLGRSRLEAALSRSSGNALEIGSFIVDDISAFVGDEAPIDDMCLVCLSRKD